MRAGRGGSVMDSEALATWVEKERAPLRGDVAGEGQDVMGHAMWGLNLRER